MALNNDGAAGFVHYTKEALQQLEAMRGHRRIPLALATYISHKAGRAFPADDDPGYVATARNDLSRTNVLVVEISSLKEIRYRDFYLQINRLREHLIAVDRSLVEWLRGLAREKDVDRAAYAQRTRDPLLEDIILHATVEEQTKESMRRDMEMIASAHGGDTVFVSHFNTPNFGGDRIPIRERLAEYVASNAHDLGVRCFNPRHLVEGYGRQLALKDMAHYTASFRRALAENLYAWLGFEDTRGDNDEEPG